MGKEILVSAIVSTYNSERFMQHCLEDLERQTIADQLEIIVIDSCSPEKEGDIVKAFQSRYGNIVYLRTDQREGLYTAWNRAIAMAKGKYLTNANTDDRHHPSSFEKLVKQLEAAPECVLAYHDQLTSTIENETFEACAARNTRRFKLPDFSHETLILGCLTGSQPMWRRSVHAEHGVFSEKYRVAADYEFWLRIAQTHPFIHIAEPLGLFYDSPDTLSGANNRFSVDKETMDIQLAYVDRAPWNKNPQNRSRLAQTVFSIGYHYVEKLQDLTKAKLFLWEAWKLDVTNLSLAKTFILRGVFKSQRGLKA
ncbi:MAG: glycosyltransferase [Rhodoferax sp.]|uniref:glycosyltransferase n=1 Tax=Rhodoferax sp. TaxID=50421 RepID=UPI003265B2C8